MIRTVLTYTYAGLATPLAIFADRMPISRRERKKRSGHEARSPLEAAEYRADELVSKPLRTLWLLAGYQIVFTGGALCGVSPEQAGNLFVGLGLIGIGVKSVTPTVLMPLLVPIGAALGLAFALIFHQVLLAMTEIRMYFA